MYRREGENALVAITRGVLEELGELVTPEQVHADSLIRALKGLSLTWRPVSD
jgi:hypothetical protein